MRLSDFCFMRRDRDAYVLTLGPSLLTQSQLPAPNLKGARCFSTWLPSRLLKYSGGGILAGAPRCSVRSPQRMSRLGHALGQGAAGPVRWGQRSLQRVFVNGAGHVFMRRRGISSTTISASR